MRRGRELAPTKWFGFLFRCGDNRRAAIVVFGVLLVACTIAWALGRGEKGESLTQARADGDYYYAYLPSIWLDRDLDFENQYKTTGNWYRLRRTASGKESNVFGIGPAVFESPLFLIGHVIARVVGGPTNGFSDVEKTLTGWASVFASVLAVVFAFRLIRRRLTTYGAVALSSAIIVFAAGPVIYYAIRQPGYAHPFASLFAAWFIERWDASYDSPRTVRTWVTLGALFGAAVLARPQLVFWAVALAHAAVADLRAGHATRSVAAVVGRLAAGAVVSIAVFSPQLLAWKALYGSYYVVPQGEHFMRWDAPAWSEVLFSSRNGLFAWSPLYAIAAVGLFVGLRTQLRLFSILLVGVAAQVLANGAVWDWWAGGSFGGRRFDSTYVAFAAGAGVLFDWCTRTINEASWRRVPACAVAGCTVVGCIWLAIANVLWTSKSTPRNARIQGGQPAAEVFRKRLGFAGTVPAWVSSAATFPARATFALRHDVGLNRYDRVVGVHWLGETYPGLNSKMPKQKELRKGRDINIHLRTGFKRRPVGDAIQTEAEKATIFVGLNRRGKVRVTVTLSAASGPVTLLWNERQKWSTDVSGSQTAIFEVSPVRGTNVLELRAKPGALVYSIELTSSTFL